MFGKEFEIATYPIERKGKRIIVKYTEVDEATQRMMYFRFKEYYDHLIQRTLK